MLLLAAYAKNFASFPGAPFFPIIVSLEVKNQSWVSWADELCPGEEMHWVKLLLEAWTVLGIATVILGLFWTTRQSREVSKQAANPKLQTMQSKQFI